MDGVDRMEGWTRTGFPGTARLVFLAVLFTGRAYAELIVSAAWHDPFVQRRALRAESNAAVNAAKTQGKDLGCALQVVIRNDTATPAGLDGVAWERNGVAPGKPDYGLVWQRLQPDPLPAGREGLLTLCLRQRLVRDTRVTVRFRDGRKLVVPVPLASPPLRIEAVTFEVGLQRVYLYVSAPAGTRATDLRLYRNGSGVGTDRPWLTPAPVAGILIAAIDLPEVPARGSVQVFRLEGGESRVAAAVRAFDRLSVFGTYGRGDFERIAFNGLSGYNSFGKLGKAALDQAWALGIRCAMMARANPPEDARGHPGVYAYVLTDEPDCRDYGVKDRPMGKRIGAHAPEMLSFAGSCIEKDPVTPTMLTLNLTFTPINYFYYGQIADIANPDCYAITCGWPIQVVKNYLDTVREACAPRPFSYTYQGCWEEYAKKGKKNYVGADELRRTGWAAFRDPDRTRGLGRAPAPREVSMAMLYGIGCGAKGLFSYIDASEIVGTLMFHGTEDLPELWEVIGRTSRMLGRVGPLIEIGHPVEWAVADRPTLWVRTLLAGDRGAIIVALNEDGESAKEEFRQRSAEGVEFHLPKLSWLGDCDLVRVGDGAWQALNVRRGSDGLRWRDDIMAGAVYIAAPRPTLENLERLDQKTAGRRARAIVAGRRARLREKARRRMRIERLVRGPANSRLRGEPIAGYGTEDRACWNPAGERYNAIDFWERQGVKTMGVRWTIHIPADWVGRPCAFTWQGRLYGGKAKLVLTGPDGKEVVFRELSNVGERSIRDLQLRFPAPGRYNLSVTVTPEAPREHGGRIARVAFFKPADAEHEGP